MDNPKKKITNAELLDFIKENVATKTELENLAKKSDLDSIKADIVSIKADMLTKSDFEKFKTEEFQPFKSDIEKLATRVNKFIDEDYPFSLKRLSRVDYRTKKLLGNKIDAVDDEFEDQYQGEAELRQTKTEG